MGRVETQVEELPENRVRLTVEVPRDAVQHAVDHAASDLAGSVKIPGFRKGKVPLPVLLARVGKERLYSEAVESHIGGWFRNAALTSRVRPVSRPEYEYELPSSADETFSFRATVDIQPKVEPADWTKLEVPSAEPEVPAEALEAELNALRDAVAELAPAERPVQEGDTVVVDLVSPSGEAQRDYVVEVGSGRLVEEIERALLGMSAGETQTVQYVADESTASAEVAVKEVKEKILPPLDDDLARTASEFDTLAELRADIEGRLHEQLEAELESEFRAAAVDRLVEATRVQPAPALVDSRANELLSGMLRSLDRRGISIETYLAVTGQTPEELRDGLRAEAARSVARELVLEAVAEKLGLEVTDDELREFIREQAREAGEEDPDTVVESIWHDGRPEQLREDLLLRKALDRVVADVQRIPVELAAAREKLWTPGQEKAAGDTKLWTPGKGGANR
jgi:trigger factor